MQSLAAEYLKLKWAKRRAFHCLCNPHSTQLLLALSALAPLYPYLDNVMSSTFRGDDHQRVQQEVTSHGLFIPGNEEARINKLFAAPRRAQRSRWPSLGCVHCSGERVGVTSHLFLRATGCPAETAPVSLFSYYSPTLARTKINWTAHKGLVTQRAADE